jgi:LacI family transcriptional regulator
VPVATIFDVAERAGVSIKTVSLVVNGQPNVSMKTRERVMKAVAELGYRPNYSARSLAGARSFLIGLFYDNPIPSYVTAVQMGAVACCRRRNYHLLAEPIDSSIEDVDMHIANLLTALRPDGLILTPLVSDNEIAMKRIEAFGTPYVRIAPGADRARSAHVLMSEIGAAETMTQHLIELGHRKIGFVKGHPQHGASHQRLEGFTRVMQAAGLSVDPDFLVQGDFSFQSGFDCAEKLLTAKSKRPTAIFSSNDEMALGAMSYAHRHGLSIPSDLSIAGFDDSPSAKVVWPPLTTIRQPIFEMAEAAAEMLIDGKTDPDPTGVRPFRVLDFQLIVRDSTGPAPR